MPGQSQCPVLKCLGLRRSGQQWMALTSIFGMVQSSTVSLSPEWAAVVKMGEKLARRAAVQSFPCPYLETGSKRSCSVLSFSAGLQELVGIASAKAAGEAKLGSRVPDCAWEQCWDLGRFDKCASRNLLRLKNKYRILPLEWTNLLQWGRLRTGSNWRAALQEGHRSSVGQQDEQELALHPSS